MTIQKTAATAALLLLSLTACRDEPVPTAPQAEAPAAQTTLAELRCEGDVRTGTFACEDAQGGGGTGSARLTMLTVGGQHHYVRLAGSNTVVDAGAGTFTTTVTVQNLLLAALGTENGTTPHTSGVRVFFASGPTNGVTVGNATGQAVFLNANADYFQYAGILNPGMMSAGKPWIFNTNGASTFSFTVYVQAHVPTGTDYTAHFTQVSGGQNHSCALTQAGKAYCWGGGQALPSPVEMPAGVSFTSISAGSGHNCALGSDGRAWCWGSDAQGQLGNGTTLTENQQSPLQVEMPAGVSFTSISARHLHTCALDSDSRAWCWGWDGYAQLGNGHTLTDNQPSPSQVQMPAGVTFSRVEAAAVHTCALGSDDRAYCWGSDTNGQLGNGTALGSQSSPSPVEMPAGVSFSSIAPGIEHTCALGSDSRAYCWGSDSYGKLGDGTTLIGIRRSPFPVEMPAGVTFSSISAALHHTCAMGSDTRAYCWGQDDYGRLGNGTTLTTDQQTPSLVEVPAGVSLSRISATFYHTCAVGPGPSYCWGRNESRTLGDGTSINRAAPVAVAGTR
jgi:alpha-tubulin suppressor-like RCC1 family protein